MPYFKNKDINLLFIHIPKTGGTSLEIYFSKKYNIALENLSLFSHDPKFIKEYKINISSQHLTYNTIIKHNDYFKIDMNNIQLLTIVRNPYHRFISNIFWMRSMSKKDYNISKDEMYITSKNIIENYNKNNNYNDNHITPQYLFVTDNNKKLINNIEILRTETLNDDMKNVGYIDFNLCINKNHTKINYMDYLNNDSIKLLNDFYNDDFLIFNYDKIQVVEDEETPNKVIE